MYVTYFTYFKLKKLKTIYTIEPIFFLDQTKSDIYHISTGVPLGSISSPLLFIIYMFISDLCIVSKLFKMINDADDTTLYSTLDVFGTYISTILIKVAAWSKLNKFINQHKKIQLHCISHASRQVNIPNIMNIEVKISK